MMEEARRRNPKIKLMALAWDFPGWLKEPSCHFEKASGAEVPRGARAIRIMPSELPLGAT